jgi:hypothetical protein
MITATVKSTQSFTPPGKNPATGLPFTFAAGLTVVVTFTDTVAGTTDDITFQNITSPIQLAQLVQRQQIAYAQAQAAVSAPPTAGQPVDLSVLTPSPVDPTPEQLVAGAYSSALSFANQIKAAVTAGAVAPDDALVVAAQATVQAAFAAIQPALTDQQVALDAAVSSAASALALKKAVG